MTVRVYCLLCVNERKEKRGAEGSRKINAHTRARTEHIQRFAKSVFVFEGFLNLRSKDVRVCVCVSVVLVCSLQQNDEGAFDRTMSRSKMCVNTHCTGNVATGCAPRRQLQSNVLCRHGHAASQINVGTIGFVRSIAISAKV